MKKLQEEAKTQHRPKTAGKVSGISKYKTKQDAQKNECFYTVGEQLALSNWNTLYNKGVKDLATFKKTLISAMESCYTGGDVFTVTESSSYVIVRCGICKKYQLWFTLPSKGPIMYSRSICQQHLANFHMEKEVQPKETSDTQV